MPQPTLLEQGARFNHAYQTALEINTCGTRAAARLSQAVLVALFIIGCMGASGNFPGGIIGWATLGMSAGYMLIKLGPRELQKRKIDVISSAALATLLVIFGTLSASGVITDIQAGYALIGTCALTSIASIITMVCARRLRDATKNAEATQHSNVDS